MLPQNRFRCFIAGVLASFAAGSFAAPIPGLFNTGVDNSNTPLVPGSVDPHWVLSVAPAGGPNAIAAGSQPSGWVSDTSDSKWISNTQNGNSAQPGGSYRYDLTFDLTGFDHTTAQVTGLWASDNSSQLLLNNALVQTHSGGSNAYASFDSFNLTAGFAPGVNTLSVALVNNLLLGLLGTATGLHVDNLQGSAVQVPEPATLVFYLVGFSVISLIRLPRFPRR